MATVIDGKAVAADVVETVKIATLDLVAQTGVRPGIAVVIVGEDQASQGYVASKGRKAKECGFRSETHTLAGDTTQADLLALLDRLNTDPQIHGILVQLPLPDHIDAAHVVQTVSPEKDVDGLNFVNVGKLGAGALETALVPCTPGGVMVLIGRTHGRDLCGLNAVVVGRSNLVGRPVAALLLSADATVTIAHSRTKGLPEICRCADILVAAVGRAEMIKGDWIKPGATVIDVGITRIPAPEKGEGKTRLVGDVDFAAASQIAATITPVPGGVGPMTIAMLMANTLTAACRAAGRRPPEF